MKLTFNFIFLFIATMFALGCSVAQEQPGNVDATEFSKLLKGKNGIIIDVRTEEEFKSGHIPGAVNIDYNSDNFLKQLQEQFKSDMPLFIYCASANRSTKAMKLMKENNFTEVYNLLDGIAAWRKAGFETE